MEIVPDESAVQFVWRNYTEFSARANKISLVAIAVIGIFVVGGAYFLSFLPMIFFGVGIALIPIPLWVRPRRQLRIVDRCVMAVGQPIWSNPAMWWTGVFTMITFAIVVQIVSGETQSWRLYLPAGAGLALCVMLGRYAYMNRGPIRIDSIGVARGDASLEYSSSEIRIETLSNGIPLIAIRLSEPGGQSVRVDPRNYDLSFNGLMSALEQLRVWCLEGRHTTPAEIMAMLTIDPPEGLEIGQSVLLTLPVQEAE